MAGLKSRLSRARPGRRKRADDVARAREAKTRAKKMAHFERKVEALLRRMAIDSDTLPYPERLLAQRFGIYSQNEEDGIICALLEEAGMSTRAFVEIGCGRSGGNSGYLARELGFRGLMVDATPRIDTTQARFGSERVAVLREFVTAENVSDLIADHGLEDEIDLLSIDIDGNDLWIWNGVTNCSPRIVVMEYNASWGGERALTIPYEPQFDRGEQAEELMGRFFGASLAALVALGRNRGYRLVCTDPEGVNAFFLRSDVAPDIPELGLAAGFTDSERNQRLKSTGFDLVPTLDSLNVDYVDFDRAGIPPPGGTITSSGRVDDV